MIGDTSNMLLPLSTHSPDRTDRTESQMAGDWHICWLENAEARINSPARPQKNDTVMANN
jgi:hypothetical protein